MHENAVTDPLSRVPQQHNGLNSQGACQATCPFVLRPREAVWGPLKTRTGHLTAFSGLGGGVRHEHIFDFGQFLVFLVRFFLSVRAAFRCVELV